VPGRHDPDGVIGVHQISVLDPHQCSDREIAHFENVTRATEQIRAAAFSVPASAAAGRAGRPEQETVGRLGPELHVEEPEPTRLA
jgi:hypothetical protein